MGTTIPDGFCNVVSTNTREKQKRHRNETDMHNLCSVNGTYHNDLK